MDTHVGIYLQLPHIFYDSRESSNPQFHILSLGAMLAHYRVSKLIDL